MHHGCQTFRGSPTTTRSGLLGFFSEIHPTITLSMNNRVTLCSYCKQLSTVLCEQLRILVDNIMHLFFDCPKLHHTRTMRQLVLRRNPRSHQYIDWQHQVPRHRWIWMWINRSLYKDVQSSVTVKAQYWELDPISSSRLF